MTVHLLLPSGDARLRTDVAQRVEFIAQADVAHGEGLFHVRTLLIVHLAAVALQALHVDVGVVHIAVVVHAVGAVGELALLSADEGGDVLRGVASTEAHIAVVAIEGIASCCAVGCGLLVHDDVEYATCAFGIIFGSGISDDLDVLHHRCWHRLEYL